MVSDDRMMRQKWPFRQNAARWDWRTLFASFRLSMGGPIRTLALTFLVNDLRWPAIDTQETPCPPAK
jgi:hypothetical protein